MIGKLLSFFAITCVFCGKAGNLSTATNFFGYGANFKFHPNCLKYVLNNPEECGNNAIDMAIEIEQCLEHGKRLRKARVAAAKRYAEYL